MFSASCGDRGLVELTFLNAVLLGALVVLVLLLTGDTLDALVVVVLVGSTLGGVLALCSTESAKLVRREKYAECRSNCSAIGASNVCMLILQALPADATHSLKLRQRH